MKIKFTLLICTLLLIQGFARADNTDNITSAIQKLKKLPADYTYQLANSIRVYADRYNLPPLLIVMIVFKESSFRVGVVGDHGRSTGLMQTGRLAKRFCRSDCKTATSQVDREICEGSCWFAHARNVCKGSIRAGLTMYASGRCRAATRRTYWLVKQRLKLWEGLRR